MKITRAVAQEKIGTLAGLPVFAERRLDDEDCVVQPMKSFKEMAEKSWKVTDTKALSNFEQWVHLTAKLIGRSYIQTFKLVQHWPEHKIERRYKEAMGCNRDLTTPQIRWWSLRKKDKAEP